MYYLNMKKFNLKSYLTGLFSGLLVCLFVLAVFKLFQPDNNQIRPRYPQNITGLRDDPERLEMMAERFGMTAEELQAELDAGKTMREIAEEKGLEDMGFTRPEGRPGNEGFSSSQSSNISSQDVELN